MAIKYLYTPPPGGERYQEEILAWHQKMSAEYKQMKESYPPKVLYRWLRKAGIDRAQMDKWGIHVEPHTNFPLYASDVYSSIFDHAHVIKRRSDGVVFILGEPYTDLSELEAHPCLQAWRELESEVICSKDSGWLPRNTVSVLISEPRRGGAAK